MERLHPVISAHPSAHRSPTPNKPAYALISVHGDPAIELGKEGAGGQNLYVRLLGLALAKRGCQVDIASAIPTVSSRW